MKDVGWSTFKDNVYFIGAGWKEVTIYYFQIILK